MRRPILTANWKLHKLRDETRTFVHDLNARLSAIFGDHLQSVEIVIAPPFTALAEALLSLAGSPIGLAAQTVSAEASGAFTGEISAAMLADAGCRYCLIGHSERRQLFGETDEDVARKAAALLAAGVRPIVCVGETLAERESDETERTVERQLEVGLAKIPAAKATEVVVAYEPVWAIGTGLTATPEQAQRAHRFIRETLAHRFGTDAESIRIQYGGSVNAQNIAGLMAQPDIDGALVGGASLDPDSFAAIVTYDRREDTTTSC
jgi:triosephosphate isomerase